VLIVKPRTFPSVGRFVARTLKIEEPKMSSVKKAIQIASAAVLVATGFVAMIPSAASAAVVCNRAGDCWHAERTYRYPRAMAVVRHPDHWYFHQTWNDRRHWRDYHTGRGYYRNGIWVTF
jgi:hypothetical protein